MIKNKYKNILFDLDGTLTDPIIGITNCIKYSLEKLDVMIPGDLSWCIGPPLQDSFQKLLNGDQDVDKAIKYYRDRFQEKGLYENIVYKDIPQYLELLKKSGKILFVATSKPEVYAKRIIDHFDLTIYFKRIYGSELDGTRKEKTDLIKYILENEELNLKETIMIGDRKYDLIGGKNNNIATAGVLWGYGSKEELENESPEILMNTPEDLIKFISIHQ